MDSYASKVKSTPFTLDTLTGTSGTFGHSIFQKDIIDVPNQRSSYFVDRQSIDEENVNPFTQRAKIDVRQRYLYRLLGDEKFQKIPSIKHQHSKTFFNEVFIYDWDDTLLFTSYLRTRNFTEPGEQIKRQLKQLDQLVCSILNWSIENGSVFIITNAINGWIKYSSKQYLPETHKLLNSSKKIMLWSARQLFQEFYPHELKMWKVETFKKIKHYIHRHILTNVICVGDRQDDMQACQVLVDDFDLIYIKKIKFQERPKPEELIKQLRLLEKKLQKIFYSISNTTIKLAKRILTPQTIRNKSGDYTKQVSSQKKMGKFTNFS